MEMGRQIEAETQLPEEIIQQIQSFLSVKAAAQSAVLDKSWYNAWTTRPNLNFVETDFRSNVEFVIFATRTMQKYQESNTNIHSFRLWITGSIDRRMIVKAMKLGATDLDIKLSKERINFILPREVLQSQTLARLSLDGNGIQIGAQVRCSGLKSLSLNRVSVEDNNLWPIISLCHNLSVLLLEKMIIGECIFSNISGFPCLKELALHDCVIRNSGNEIQMCSNSLERISFTECQMIVWRVKFDVPSIRKFKFSGVQEVLPFLSCFKTAAKEWESDIFITYTCSYRLLKTSWTHRLRKFLLGLSPPRITLSLNVALYTTTLEGCDYEGDIHIIPKVEKLKLIMFVLPYEISSAALEYLFWTCRPNFITLYWLVSSLHLPFPFSGFCEEINCFTKFLYNALEKQVRDHESKNMCALLPLRGLVEIKAEFFEDDDVAGRRLLPWKTLLEASTNSGKMNIEICLQLKWGEYF